MSAKFQLNSLRIVDLYAEQKFLSFICIYIEISLFGDAQNFEPRSGKSDESLKLKSG